jgi:hypothetical protein
MPYWPPDSPPSEPPQMPASSFSIQAPYAPGSPDPVHTGQPGAGADDVAGDVAAAVTNAEARFTGRQSETYGQGSVIGDLMTFPASPLDTPAGPGLTDPSGHYFDPPRAYGNEPT